MQRIFSLATRRETLGRHLSLAACANQSAITLEGKPVSGYVRDFAGATFKAAMASPWALRARAICGCRMEMAWSCIW